MRLLGRRLRVTNQLNSTSAFKEGNRVQEGMQNVENPMGADNPSEPEEKTRRPRRKKPRPPVDVTPYTLDFPTNPVAVDWTGIFGNDRPVELEVGSGKGLFLINAGSANPDRNYLGIEIAKKYAANAADRIARRELTNVRMLAGDATRFLNLHVPPASLSVVHVYFPDPWWKKRHRKRRVFSETLVRNIVRALIPGGQLWVVTDVEEYFGVIKELVASNGSFDELPDPQVNDPEHEHDYLTNFERKYRIEGRPIYRKHYRLR